MDKRIPGVNIQWPWTELLLSGKKTIETRTYPLPRKYEGVELAIIETPGPRGKKEADIERARVIGTIVFEGSFQYETEEQWVQDADKHQVNPTDPQFSWAKRKCIWGWKVKRVRRFNTLKPAPLKRGIIFATACEI